MTKIITYIDRTFNKKEVFQEQNIVMIMKKILKNLKSEFMQKMNLIL